MGRPRKALALHKMEGTYRPDRHEGRVDDPGLLVAPVDAPTSLTDARALNAWKLVVNRLAMTHRIAPEDLPSIEAAFHEYEQFWIARDHLKDIPTTDTADYKAWHTIMKSSLQVYTDIMRRFGTSALDRQLIRATIEDKPKDTRSLMEKMCGDDSDDDE